MKISPNRKNLHAQLQEVAPEFIDGSPDGYEVLESIYPKHLYEATRRKIAIELSGKEIAKIVDAENNKELSRIRKSTRALYEGRYGVYAPVHDFWSFVEMVSHIKKKEFPELITAANVSWSTKSIQLDQLQMTWMPFLENNTEIFGPRPWNVKDILDIFSAEPELREAAITEQLHTADTAQHKFEHADEPITIVARNGNMELVDGNGRLYRAILHQKDEIKCHVGTMDGPVPRDYWVGAGWINQFCLEIRGYAETDHEAYISGLRYLQAKFRTNDIALINYELFLRKNFPEFEEHLAEVLSPWV